MARLFCFSLERWQILPHGLNLIDLVGNFDVITAQLCQAISQGELKIYFLFFFHGNLRLIL